MSFEQSRVSNNNRPSLLIERPQFIQGSTVAFVGLIYGCVQRARIRENRSRHFLTPVR